MIAFAADAQHMHSADEIVTDQRTMAHMARVSPYAGISLCITEEQGDVFDTLKNQGEFYMEAIRAVALVQTAMT